MSLTDSPARDATEPSGVADLVRAGSATVHRDTIGTAKTRIAHLRITAAGRNASRKSAARVTSDSLGRALAGFRPWVLAPAPYPRLGPSRATEQGHCLMTSSALCVRTSDYRSSKMAVWIRADFQGATRVANEHKDVAAI
jgi:hypothetical protein